MDITNDLVNWLDPSTLMTRLADLGVRIAAGIAIFILFWIAGSVAQSVLRRIFLKRDLNRDVEELAEQGVRIVLTTLGIVTGLGTMGIDVGALVASLGLVGFAVGFALKDAISNLLSGVLILLYQPFERGDTVAVGPKQGRVVDIDLRYTELETPSQRILVPNSHLFSNVVTVDKVGVETQD